MAVEVDLVLDSPQSPRAEHVVYRVNNARQEDSFLKVKGDAVISHGPVAVEKRRDRRRAMFDRCRNAARRDTVHGDKLTTACFTVRFSITNTSL